MISRLVNKTVEVTFMNGDRLVGELLQADNTFLLVRSQGNDFYLPLTAVTAICKTEG